LPSGPRRPMTACPGQRAPTRMVTPCWHSPRPPPRATLSPPKPQFHVRLGLILPPFQQEKHSTALLPCPAHRHLPLPMSCPAHPHVKLPSPLHRASSRRDCLSCTTEPSPSPRTHDQSPKRSRRRPPGREGTTPSTLHLRPPSTTGDATSSSVVTPSCSTTRSRPPRPPYRAITADPLRPNCCHHGLISW
jgi:hypothetical protein